MPELFVETVKQRSHGMVLSSDVRPATEADIAAAKQLHEAGQCPHNIIYDIPSWPYDVRVCGTCGAGLGVV